MSSAARRATCSSALTTSDEWYGYGGYPGQNSTGAVSGLNATYQYYPDDSADGSVTISYSTGAPGAPTAVSGVAGDGSVAVSWTAPSRIGRICDQ